MVVKKKSVLDIVLNYVKHTFLSIFQNSITIIYYIQRTGNTNKGEN
jgi:hypothetical protein